jgi:hypothetical protein
LFTGTIVSPQWVWIVAHLALGMLIGLGFLIVRRRLVT